MSRSNTLKSGLYLLGAFVAGYLAVQAMVTTLSVVDHPDLGLWGGSMVYGALLEELVKFAIALSIFRLCGLPAVAGLVGLGYGLGERLLYLTATGTVVPQDFAALGMHIMAGFSSAYFLSKHKVTSRRRDFVYALLAPIVVHGVYNTCMWVWYQWVLSGL